MSSSVLVLGNSGTGKSTSIRNLPPEQTFIVNVEGKPLPFRGSAKMYTKLSSNGLTGNYYCSDDSAAIKRVINLVSSKRPEIKYLVLDDIGFTVMNSYMRSCMQKGFDKFVTLSADFASIIEAALSVRDDLFCFLMMHVDVDENGMTKPATVGNAVDKYVKPHAKFTYVLHTTVHDGNYQFVTNNDNLHMCKSPIGCFDQFIDNDLLLVANKINEYNNYDSTLEIKE